MTSGARRVPRSLVLVDGALTDADLAWVNRQLEPCETRGVRSGQEGRDIPRPPTGVLSTNEQRAAASGRRPAYLDAPEVDLGWVSTVIIR